MVWTDKTAVVCTMHGKETVIKPALHSLGLNWISANFDTDQFGTFSTEVARVNSPLETARKKCQLAFDNTDATIAIASEGSFGPHPMIPFLPINEEIILFSDREQDIEISISSLSTETNFSSKYCTTWEDVESFAKHVGFPTHGLILKADGVTKVHKGINNPDLLQALFEQVMKTSNGFTLETDMRAMFNPTRMKHIYLAAEKLSSRLLSCCPSCHKPGFGEERVESGLPCALCGLPTDSILLKEVTCVHCQHQSITTFPNGKEHEDPQFCSYCNP